MLNQLLDPLRRLRYRLVRRLARKPVFDAGDLARLGYVSQYGQDRWVSEVLVPGDGPGVFVDIGAHDGVSFSNTCYLERVRGWTGLAVEPIPEIYQKLRANRRCRTVNGCVADKPGRVQFQAITGYAQMLSGIVDQYDPRHLERIERDMEAHGGGERRLLEVECYPLGPLLDEHGLTRVDYLTIDAEGAELAILRSVDWGRHQIAVIGVENNYDDHRIPEYLRSVGYRLDSIVGDQFYVRRL